MGRWDKERNKEETRISVMRKLEYGKMGQVKE